MKIGNIKVFGCLVISMLLAVAFTVPAFAESVTSPAHPKRPNVVWDVSERKVVIVHLLNATPYNLELKSGGDKDFKNGVSGTEHSVQAQNAGVSPFLFSPSGIPHKIAADTGASFVVAWLDTTSTTGKAGHNVYPDANLTYTLKNVDASALFQPSACTKIIDDVDINIGFNRVQESKNLEGDIFKLIIHSTSLIVDSIELYKEPNMTSILGWITSAVEISEDAKEIKADNQDSDQVYFSAFAVSKRGIDQYPGIYTTNSNDTVDSGTAAKYDGLFSLQAYTEGCPQAYIVAATSIIRETKPSDTKMDGHLPTVFVTLATAIDWENAINSQTQVSMQASTAGHNISQHLQREGRKGQIAFIKLARTLNRDDQKVFREAYKSIKEKKALSQAQEALLVKFYAALEKNEKSILKDNASKTLENKTPVHRSK